MKILLINPPYINFGGVKESGGHAIPLNLLYLAAYLRKKMACDLSILDAEILGFNYAKIENRIMEEKPDIIGITAPTPAMDHVIKISKIIKKINNNCFIVLGGAHPTAMPKETAMIDEIDFVVRGEGEITFYELVRAIENNGDFSKIKGIAFKDKGKIIVTEDRELISDIDTLPFPARDLINFQLYRSAPTKRVSSSNFTTSIFTSRGCPYNCTYCISKVIWKRGVRFRSPKNVVDEIEECVKKWGLEEFNFYDDTFVLNEKRVIEICNELLNRNIKISWICFARVNTITEKMLQAIKEAGCKKISFGLESGSQTILNNIRKNATIEEAKQAVAIAHKNHLKVHASFMFGNVGETKETIEMTINFAKSLNLDNATFFIVSPYPGTELYNNAVKEGRIPKDVKWSDFAPLTNTPPLLIQDTLSGEQLIKYQKKAFAEFYLRPQYLLKKLLLIRSINDLKLLLNGLTIFKGIIFKSPKT